MQLIARIQARLSTLQALGLPKPIDEESLSFRSSLVSLDSSSSPCASSLAFGPRHLGPITTPPLLLQLQSPTSPSLPSPASIIPPLEGPPLRSHPRSHGAAPGDLTSLLPLITSSRRSGPRIERAWPTGLFAFIECGEVLASCRLLWNCGMPSTIGKGVFAERGTQHHCPRFLQAAEDSEVPTARAETFGLFRSP